MFHVAAGIILAYVIIRAFQYRALCRAERAVAKRFVPRAPAPPNAKRVNPLVDWKVDWNKPTPPKCDTRTALQGYAPVGVKL